MVEFDANEFPIKDQFLNRSKSIEDNCEATTESRIWSMGNKAPACYEGIGTVLSYLDRMASCFWGCGETNHEIEYLCGAASSNGRASVRLLKMGFYDESLLITRRIGEITNLLMLFRIEGANFEEWNLFPKRFTPGKVRKRLEELTGLEPPIDRELYCVLLKRFVHSNHRPKPQAFNSMEVPTTGGMFQEAGLLVSLNELALPLAYACLAAALILNINDELTKEIRSVAGQLLEQIDDSNTLAGFDKAVADAQSDEQARETLRRQGQNIMDFQRSLLSFWHAPAKPQLPLGQWLVENMPRGTNLEPPLRDDPGRPNPFLDEPVP